MLVHELECLADEAVAQAGEPVRRIRGQVIEIAASHVDEHHFGKPFEYGIATGSRAAAERAVPDIWLATAYHMTF